MKAERDWREEHWQEEQQERQEEEEETEQQTGAHTFLSGFFTH